MTSLIIPKKYGQVTLFEVVKASLKDQELPTVFFYHGWTQFKEQNLDKAMLLAQMGIRVLLPDAYLHGDRIEGEPVSRFDSRFWEVVLQAVKEADGLKENYVKAGLTKANQIGVAGLSMGGIITDMMLTQYEWIKAGVSLMGHPDPVEFGSSLIKAQPVQESLKAVQAQKADLNQEAIEAYIQNLSKYSLAEQADKLAGRPLLIWHGAEDEVVPIEGNQRFYEANKDKDYADKLDFIVSQDVGHHVPFSISRKMADFFEKELL